MPLLLVDLDNTLSDRVTAFRNWARSYLTTRFGEADEGLIAEMERADGDGLRYKPDVAADLAELLGLDEVEQSQIIAVLRAGTLAELRPTPGVIEALDRARDAGYQPYIVTNGNVAQQQGKVAKLGLASHVAGMTISEGVGIAKPDPEIFRIAVREAGGTLAGAWMIGDSAASDIEGAAAAGLDSIWLRRGRTYPDGFVRPTAMANSFAEAVGIVLGEQPV